MNRITEKQFLQQVIQYARLYGWRVYHTHDSRRSAAGFPDLCMVKGGRLIFAELKVGTNPLTPDQSDWLMALMNANQAMFVWRPENWDQIESVLGGVT